MSYNPKVMKNLYTHFKENQKNPIASLFLTKDKNYNFEDIDKKTAQFAHRLLTLGIKPGDRVAVQIEKSVFNLFLYLACLRVGAIFLPLNNAYTEEELRYFFHDAMPSLIVCAPENLEKISTTRNDDCLQIKSMDIYGQGSLTEEIEKEPETFHTYEPKRNFIALMLYTSGTTGKPKGAMITHEGLFKNAEALVTAWGMTPNDTLLHVLPLFHAHGLFIAFNTALLAQSKILVFAKFNVDDFFEWLPNTTVFMGVPTYYTRLLNDARLTQENCAHMRLFTSGSAPLLAPTFESFQQKTGHTILERYGMTETGVNTSNPLHGERKLGSVGLALSGVTLRIVNEHNQPVETEQPGNIQVKDNGFFQAYWMKPEKTKEALTEDGYFKTGDIGLLDTEGYLTLIGRSSDMIISGGLNVYPKEIEETLNHLPDVIESAVIGVPHSDFGEAVIAVIATSTSLDEKALISLLKTRHAGYKCPKQIFFVESLPKNTMGKVQKNLLRKQFQDVFLDSLR